MAVVSDDEAPSEGLLDIFLNTISMHGLNHLHSSFHLYHRLLWTLALLVCVSALIAWSSEDICYLISYPILINLQMVMTKELVFPAVTLCKLQKMHKDSMDPFGSSPPDNFSWVDFPILAVPSRPDIIDMVIKCTFRGNNCTTEDFTPVFTRYGKCYTFNADKNNPKVTRQGGMGNGLEIMLDIQQEDYLPIWRETNETSFEAGIRVQIHSQDEPPYIHQLGFGVSPGFQTFVSCQEQRLTYLPKPWGNCRASIPGEQVLTGYSTYSISACRLQCEKEAVVKHCACRMAHMPGNETVCSPNLYIDCADHTLDTLIGETSETCTCPTPCNLTRYGKEISMVRIPHKGSASYLARKYKKNETYIRDNFLVLDIFFEALNYETIEQKKAYDLASLLGDIGGQMGLFIGASFLTVLEILDYLYEVIRDKFNRVLKRKPSPAKKPTENISTLVIDDMKEQSSCEARGRHPEGAYATTMLPNHHRHYTHHGVFEDFAC